jgi:hypothetical protein
MRTFADSQGREWVATALEESTPRHHGRFYLVFHPADEPQPVLAMPEVRWQSRASALRTLRTAGLWELQRRLAWLQQRGTPAGDVSAEVTQTQPLLRGTGG